MTFLFDTIENLLHNTISSSLLLLQPGCSALRMSARASRTLVSEMLLGGQTTQRDALEAVAVAVVVAVAAVVALSAGSVAAVAGRLSE